MTCLGATPDEAVTNSSVRHRSVFGDVESATLVEWPSGYQGVALIIATVAINYRSLVSVLRSSY